MTDKIPSFKEEIDDIHVPIAKLDAIILNTVLRSVPKRKTSLRNKVVYSAAAAVVAFGLLIGSATVSPVMATFVSQIPIIGSIFSVSGERGLERVSELGLTQVVGQSKTVNGITITIDEVFYDGTRVTVGYSEESEEPLEDLYVIPIFDVDGKRMPTGGIVRKITPTYWTKVISIEPYREVLPKKFVLGMSFEGKNGEQWNFSAPVEEQPGVQQVTINHSQQIEGIDLLVENIKIGTSGFLLRYKVVSEKYPDLTTLLEFRVVDSLGNELTMSGGGKENGNEDGLFEEGLVYGTRLFDSVDEHAKELTIIPYLSIPEQGDWKIKDSEGNLTDIDVSQFEGIDITFDSFTVKLP
ncbi:DUF4179 domain-containing protein [Sporosarcina sp. NPDC096371]|uniref:DUF4179 domain-containing protein n=1 Tax=Sporosarcina sp. NPDC096371 TaxID=3364530 RepID=UPI003815F988